MKTRLLVFLLLLISVNSYPQTCNGNTFSFPGAPGTCTYSYTSSGWIDQFGNPTVVPTNVGASDSVCILANNADVIGILSTFKGTFYVASGVTFSGQINSFGSNSQIIIDGTANFATSSGLNSAQLFVNTNASVSFPGTVSPGGSTEIHNAGTIAFGGDFSIGGQVLVTNYENASITVGGSSHIANTFSNCGSYILENDLTTSGGSSLINLCATHIKNDLILNNDYTNDAFLVINGGINFNGADLYNDGTILTKDITLDNDDLIGNDNTSTLIVTGTAILSSGGSITGHYYFDDDDGGGFDSVCGSCVEDIDKLIDVNIPALFDESIENCGSDLNPASPTPLATLDFDGVDDYLSTDAFIGGLTDITLMAWYKADGANAGTTTIVGEDRGAKLYLRSGSRPTFAITTQGNSMIFTPTGVVAKDEWHHIAGTYSSSTGKLKLYVDGVLVNTLDSGVTGVPIETSTLTSEAFAVGRTSRGGGTEYFDGAIDEVRVFDTVLTDDQIQRMVYQEIQENMGNVQGSVIAKDVVDITTDTKVLWNDLLAYYPMTDIISFERTVDYSNYNRLTFLHNITTLQEQTAPMPYVADTDGAWTTQNTWEHGDVWDIENTASNKDWSIVRINSKVTTTASHTQLGMIIEDNNSLTVNGDNEINNSWYLELNGTLDLSGDSQLVQGQNSDLVTSATGKIARRQSGASNVYWYTYMSSPVGATAATSLIDNNTAANNPNNTAFTFNTLKEGNGSPVEFTSAYNEVGKLSTRWMYTFLNGITYYDWAHYGPTTALNPGVGYIHKGTGNAGLTQEYLFEGKPNNGTVLIAADDVDGDSGNESQADVTQTTTLIGNPYPSAIDAHKFIDDNISVIDGTLYLWQQWAGDNHILAEYEGGYAVLNKMSKIRAYQFVGYSGADNGSQDGTLTPTQYIAPGQSFMTEVVEDGNIEFNNAQRIFKKESGGETTFFRGMTEQAETEEAPMSTIRLEFVTSDMRSRELVIGFGDQTTNGYDRGYDAKMFDLKSDDIYMTHKDDKLIANALPAFNAAMEVPVGLNATGNYKYKIKATKLVNFPANVDILLRDNQTKTYHDIRTSAYQFKSKPGAYDNRFDIVFVAKGKEMEQEQAQNDVQIYFNTTSDRLFIKGLDESAKGLTLTNMAGQQVLRLNQVATQDMVNGIHLTNLSSGLYIVSLTTDNNTIIDKKIIID